MSHTLIYAEADVSGFTPKEKKLFKCALDYKDVYYFDMLGTEDHQMVFRGTRQQFDKVEDFWWALMIVQPDHPIRVPSGQSKAVKDFVFNKPDGM